MKKGIKLDTDKLRWTLLFLDLGEEIEILAKILEMGAKKYAPSNWKKVTPLRRYKDALLRHTMAALLGEKLDKESGLEHWGHVAVNALFLMWKERNK